MDRLQGKKIDWYVNDMHTLKGSTSKRRFAPISSMEEIRLILAYACSKNIKVYQMDVK
jgi:hypothetical protein